MTKPAFEVAFEFGQDFERLITNLHEDIAIKAMEEGAKAAGKIIADAVEPLIPRGDEGKAPSKRQSKAYKAKYNKDPLHRKIRYAIRKRKYRVYAVVGAKYPDGNEIYPLLSGHRFVRWDPSKSVSGYIKESDDFLNKAFHQSKAAAGQAALKKAGEVIQKMIGAAKVA